MPPEQKIYNASQSSKVNYVYVIIFLLIVLGLIFAFAPSFNKNKKTTGPSVDEKAPDENVVVTKVDLKNTTGQDKIPQGFPLYIPLETNDAYESYTMDYKERNLTQYSVSYQTSATVSQKYKEYLDVMTKNGFEFAKDGKNEATGFLLGSKNNDDLTVVISRSGEKTSVQISYLDRK